MNIFVRMFMVYLHAEFYMARNSHGGYADIIIDSRKLSKWIWDSSVKILTRPRAGRTSIPGRERDSSLCHRVQLGSRAREASYSTDTGGNLCPLPRPTQFKPEDGVSKVLRNVGTLPQHYTASQPRRPWHESSSLCKPTNSVSHIYICF
jgi:hypothetical protein